MNYKPMKALICAVSVFLLLICAVPPVKVMAAQTPDSGQFNIDLICGLEGYSKYDSDVPVRFQVTNNGDDFTGEICLALSFENISSQRVGYTYPLEVSSGDTQTIQFVVPNLGTSLEFDISITDEDGEECFSQNLRHKIIYSDDFMIGILTDDFGAVNYLDGMAFYTDFYEMYFSSRIFSLDQEAMPEDGSVLKAYDLLIINDFNVASLSQTQYDVLTDWIYNGGTVMIGTGANYEATLMPFLGDCLEGAAAGVENVSTNFGLDGYDYLSRSTPLQYEAPSAQIVEEEAELESSDEETADDVELDGNEGTEESSVSVSVDSFDTEEDVSFISQPLETVEPLEVQTAGISLESSQVYDDLLCQSVKVGDGTIIVLDFDLAAGEFGRWAYNAAAVQKILIAAAHVSDYGSLTDDFISDYYAQDMLSNFIEDRVPRLGPFVAVIVVYLVLISPVIYFIFKKKDRRQWMWLFIPVTVVVFTGIIFFMGRMMSPQTPYINYAAILKSYSGKVYEDTYFSVTSPENQEYMVQTEGDYTVRPLYTNLYAYNSYESGNNSDGFALNLTYGAGETDINAKYVHAFDSRYFIGERESVWEGSVDVDITFVVDHYEGTVTNHTGYTLEHGFLKLGNLVIDTGNLENGESYNIDSRNGVVIESYYEIPGLIFGKPSQKERMLNGFVGALRNSGYSSYQMEPGNIFCAFVDGYSADITTDYPLSGNALLWANVLVEYSKDGVYSVPNILYESQMITGDLDGMDGCFYSDEIVFQYDLSSANFYPETLTLTTPMDTAFIGCSLYCPKTESYEEIFTDGQRTVEGDDLTKYIDSSGCLRIRFFKIDSENYAGIALPAVSITGREY